MAASSGPLSVLLGLLSAAVWGAGDFSGGMASKRHNVFQVIAWSQVVGVLLLFVAAVGFGEPLPTAGDLWLGALAGICGGLGLAALYRGLSTSRMGLVAPVAAVVTAAIPVVAAALLEGLPSAANLIGFITALAAVWLLAGPPGEGGFRPGDLTLPLLAGIGFGLFFVLIDQAVTDATFWPLVSARIASLLMLSLLLKFRRQPRFSPAPKYAGLTALAGVLDAGGNVLYALATIYGRLDTAAVLASLYPVATVLLARIILKEHLHRTQWVGVGVSLLALFLITA